MYLSLYIRGPRSHRSSAIQGNKCIVKYNQHVGYVFLGVIKWHPRNCFFYSPANHQHRFGPSFQDENVFAVHTRGALRSISVVCCTLILSPLMGSSVLNWSTLDENILHYLFAYENSLLFLEISPLNSENGKAHQKRKWVQWSQTSSCVHFHFADVP